MWEKEGEGEREREGERESQLSSLERGQLPSLERGDCLYWNGVAALLERGGCLTGTGWLSSLERSGCLTGAGWLSSLERGQLSFLERGQLSSLRWGRLSSLARHVFIIHLYYFITLLFFSNPFLLVLGCLRFRRFASSVPDKLSLLRIHCSRLGFFADSLGGLVLRHHEL